LLLYVDDMIITGNDSIGILELKQFLNQHFEMKDLGNLSYFLGRDIFFFFFFFWPWDLRWLVGRLLPPQGNAFLQKHSAGSRTRICHSFTVA
jgi:hypothetical protein